MKMLSTPRIPLAPSVQASYRDGLAALVDARVPFLVGGGFGLAVYLPFWRATKDLDVFVRPRSVHDALAALARAGFDIEMTDPTWLAKGRREPAMVDVIFCSYNGLFRVDDYWFERARTASLFGVPVRVVAPEEMILSKCFVAARDRFDGADIAWLIRNHGGDLDWERIERLMADNWQVLLWQLVHCTYTFPSTRRVVPKALLGRLLGRFTREMVAPLDGEARTCRGPMLDPLTYLPALGDASDDPRRREDLVSCFLRQLDQAEEAEE